MQRKDSFNSRSTAAGFDHKSYEIYKQNDKDSFRLDPKIVELKRKYQLGKPIQFNSNKQPLKKIDNNQQEQVFKKLQNIKTELRLIPGWQNYARSILFQQLSFSKPHTPSFDGGHQNTTIFSKKVHQSLNSKKQNSQEGKVLNCSNISFKISQANSIERAEQKSRHLRQQYNHLTPNRKINQFNIQKTKTSNKQHIYSIDKENAKVDQKINQISRKIKQAQAQKKNLGVDFIPFQKKSIYLKNQTTRPTFGQSQTLQRSKTPECLIRKKQQYVYDKQKNSRPPKPSKTHTKVKSSQQSLSPKLFRNQANPRFPFIQQHHDQRQSRQLYEKQSKIKNQPVKNIFEWEQQILLNQKKNKNIPYYLENKPQPYNNLYQIPASLQRSKHYYENRAVQQKILDRKKKVNQPTVDKKRKKDNTIRLVQAFCQQVKLDQKFRNTKLWLKTCKNQKKFERLKSLLNMEGINLSVDKVAQQFQVLQKQDNPFFSVTSIQCDLEQVAKCFIQCQKYWKKNLYKRFDRGALEDQDFSSLTIDLQKKGYISLEDLVRFLNMETGTFFRNRDLFTIFRRLCGSSQKLNFNSFISTFCA